jgi:hypothetical protein
MLALIRSVPDYKFDGQQVADWLALHRDLWLAVTPLVLQNGPLLTGLYGGTFAANGLLVMCLKPALETIRSAALDEWGASYATFVEGEAAAKWTGFKSFPNLAVLSVSWDTLIET